MMFLLGLITGIILVIVSIFIWWYRDAHLVTGILPDDEAMWNEREKER